MTDPYLVPCLAVLRAEFNALSPGRDKGADGWIGDAAHQQQASDHNPDGQGRVMALDIDSTGPWPVPFNELVERVRSTGRSRLEYIIWNRRIATRAGGWSWETYTGTSDPHTNHAHFSARHDHTGDASTASWGLEDDMDPKEFWAEKLPLQKPTMTAQGYLVEVHDRVPANLGAVPSSLADLAKMLVIIGGKVDELAAKVDALSQGS